MDSELRKRPSEKVDQYFERLRVEGYTPSENYDGVDQETITVVLRRIGRYSEDIRDVVYSLLVSDLPSLFSKAEGFRFSDGASVAHIGGMVGILLRGRNRLDREGRDYWIKPLRDIGAIEPVTYDSNRKEFRPGHTKAKSPNSAYRLNKSFVRVLKSAAAIGNASPVDDWIAEDATRSRLKAYAQLESGATPEVREGTHERLISTSIEVYSEQFLRGYRVVYTDFADGDRVTESERGQMLQYGIELGLDDPWPDVILVSPDESGLWFIEAVTSDGEVDEHKMKGLGKICERSGMSFHGATTTYQTWKQIGQRQHRVQNLAVGSYFWIANDPTKHFRVK